MTCRKERRGWSPGLSVSREQRHQVPAPQAGSRGREACGPCPVSVRTDTAPQRRRDTCLAR